MDAKISAGASTTYTGVCSHTDMVFGTLPPRDAGQASGAEKHGGAV